MAYKSPTNLPATPKIITEMDPQDKVHKIINNVFGHPH